MKSDRRVTIESFNYARKCYVTCSNFDHWDGKSPLVGTCKLREDAWGVFNIPEKCPHVDKLKVYAVKQRMKGGLE